MAESRVGKITWSCFNYNYNYNYNLKFSITITIIQVQVIVIQLQFQLQLQRKNSQNVATNSVTDEASSFAYVNSVDLFKLLVFLYQTYQSPIFLYSCSSINLCLTLIFAIHNFACKQLSIVNNCKQSKILG